LKVRDSQVGFRISSGGFDVWAYRRGSLNHNFVSNVVSEYIVVFAEGIDRVDILVKEVCAPRRREAINRAIQGKGEVNATK